MRASVGQISFETFVLGRLAIPENGGFGISAL